MNKRLIALCVVTALICLPMIACAQQGVLQDDLGRTVKYKIFVDKVIGAGGQGGLGWGEQAVKETAEAGFNVFSPRIGGENMERVRQMTRWCQQYGVYHVPWMRGTLEAPDGPEADGKRVMWRSGGEQPLWSVNSDEFWQWTTDMIVEYAQISAEMPHLIGVFLDYENYAGGIQDSWMLYGLMYDDIIMNKFAEDRGIELPDLEPSARAPWLEEHGMHDAFSEFQINFWRERCRELREAVDRYNPKFQFFMYPSIGSLFMQQAAYLEWSTEAAPIVITTPHTYGRPGAFLPQDDALEANRQIVLRELEIPRELGIPFFYAGGIDPVVRGADPEFSGKNALMMSEISDGYWIFYEGPIYTEPDHAQYMRWFAWANQRIDEGNFAAYKEPREEPEAWVAQLRGSLSDDGAELLLPEVTGERVEFPRLPLRFDNILIVAGKAGQPVEIEMQHYSLGAQPIPLRWEVRNWQLRSVAVGEVAPGSRDSITFTPEADGPYIIPMTAGGSAYSILAANAPLGLSPGGSARFIFLNDDDRARQVPLYFYVPEGLAEFTVQIAGQGPETVRADIFNSQGEMAATGQTTLTPRPVEIEVLVGEHSGATWSLILREADEGTMEDNSIRLDQNLVPILSFSKDHVFTLKQ